MSDDALLIDVADNLARITINRPDAANAIDMALGKALMHAAIRCDEDPEIRAVLLTGAGRFFSAGGDLKSMAALGDGIGAGLKELTVYLHAAISRFARMDAPLVIAVNGVAAGAGMSLAAIGDIVLAAQSSSFVMAYTASALVPDGSSSYFLPRVIGLRRTQELMLTNRRLSAAEAADWGLVTRVVADDALADEATAAATKLAQGPTGAFGAVKRLLNESFTNPLETQMELEARAIAGQAATADGREGIAAFLEKRKPVYGGG